MQVKATKNLIYRGEIYRAGENFECEDAEKLKQRGLIELAQSTEIAQLPSLEDEIKRKKR